MASLHFPEVALAFFLLCGTSYAQIATGSITVRVQTQEGEYLPDATAFLSYPPEKTPISYAVRECKTDNTGTCTIEHVPFGRYILRAMKLTDGYPDTQFAIYAHGANKADVVLTPQEPSSKIQFVLGQKAAEVALKLYDASSGEPIRQASITLRSASEPNEFVGFGYREDEPILVPAEFDVHFEVRADKYKVWKSAEHPDVEQGNALRIRAEEVREIRIFIEPQ
jgi:hypothetical protein